MSYRWKRDHLDCITDENETIIDWAYLSEAKFILIALLTSNGGVRVISSVGNASVKRCVTNVKEFVPDATAATTICILPDASGIALTLAKGNVLLIPLRVILDITWGQHGILGNDSVAILEIGSVEDECFYAPTSALSYNAVSTKRPFLIYANKAGQILIIDLIIMAVSVVVKAPESIHEISIISANGNVHLLVTGFTGAQWFLPLEADGHGLRETLGQVIPSDLEQLGHSCAKVSVTSDGKLMSLHPSENKIKFFDDISLKKVIDDVAIPENTWLVHVSQNAIFTVSDSVNSAVIVRCALTIVPWNVQYEEIVNFPNEKILGFIPILSQENVISTCIAVTERGIVYLVPNKSFHEILVDRLAAENYSYNTCKVIAEKFKRNSMELAIIVIKEVIASLCKSAPNDPLVEKLINLARSASLEMTAITRLFADHNMKHAMVTAVLEYCTSHPEDPIQHMVTDLVAARCNAFPDEVIGLEKKLNDFLMRHPDVVDGIEKLLPLGFWSSVVLLIPRNHKNTVTVANFLVNLERQWPKESPSSMVKVLSTINWSVLHPGEAEKLLQCMITYLPYVKSVPQLYSISKIAGDFCRQMDKAKILYVLTTLRLAQAIPPSNYTCSPNNTVLSCASNCTAVVNDDELAYFWGDFSAGCLRSREVSKYHPEASRLAQSTLEMPEQICSVSCGTTHILCLTISGKLYSYGSNRYGQRGIGNFDECEQPSLVNGPFDRVYIMRAGHYHSAAIDLNGRVYTWGWDVHGQLGRSNFAGGIDCARPAQVTTFDKSVVDVACGYAHTIFLLEDGSVYACGSGTYGQLGIDDEIRKQHIPQKVKLSEPITIISSKFFHTIALSEAGTLYHWGITPHALRLKAFITRRLRSKNKTNTDESSAIDATHSATNAANFAKSNSFMKPHKVQCSVEGKVIFIDAGSSHSALLTDKGKIYTWGKSLEMQLGHGTKKEHEEPHRLAEPADVKWTNVSCGLDFTAAVASDGTVYMWGRNDKGQLGIDMLTSPSSARSIVFNSAKGRKSIKVSTGDTCIGRPRKYIAVNAFTISRSHIYEGRRQFVSFLKLLKPTEISLISQELIESSVLCLPAVYIHLLAGDLSSAIDVLVQLTENELSDTSNSNWPMIDENGAETCLIDMIWEMIRNHPGFTTQFAMVSQMLGTFDMNNSIVEDRKLVRIAPLIFAANPEVTNHIKPEQKLKILEQWKPDPSLRGMTIAQGDFQACNGRLRYWMCCGRVERCGRNIEKRRICYECMKNWEDEAQSKFSRIDKKVDRMDDSIDCNDQS